MAKCKAYEDTRLRAREEIVGLVQIKPRQTTAIREERAMNEIIV